MADSNIGSLPQAVTLDDDSLLVAEQQGQAVKVTGAQFKEFGRQAVITEVQGYVDQAEAAAEEAVSAVSSVTNMTVEAATLATGQNATVTKTIKNGKVNLAFGLPRGEQGEPGETGPTGPRGPQGPTGKGLTVLGHYDTEAALRAAVTSPEAGDAYSVGTTTPYDIYIFDGVILDWKNYGPLSGGGGVIPDDVVTADGGAEMTFPVELGYGPHTITFIDEEEPPLTAEDIQYSATQNVKQAIDDLKFSVSNGKALIASAITDKGVTTAQDATFAQMAENIEQITTGGDTSDATATSFDILAPKTAYTAVGKVEGTIPTLLGQTIIPGTADKTLSNGQYLGGTQVIKGDPNLTSNNIKSGVTLFGVEGTLESTFKASVTVTADTGAVVTATHSGGTEVSGLSQNGTVVLELPLEGTWSITAVRGVAQYNTVTLNVTSSYAATLTAEVHIVYYGSAASLSSYTRFLAATSIGNYAIFAGGEGDSARAVGSVDAYDKYLTKTVPEQQLTQARSRLSASKNNNYALFCGGEYYYQLNGPQYFSVVDAYDGNLVRNTPSPLSKEAENVGATSINEFILFGGGNLSKTEYSNMVDSYDANLTHTVLTVLPLNGRYIAASNQNYAIFCSTKAAAYDTSLTRHVLADPTDTFYSAATAGNYTVFVGNGDTANAYDLFLTRTTIDPLSAPRVYPAATTLQGFALFGGGGNLYYPSGVVDVYDPFLVRTTANKVFSGRTGLAAASIENYALFGGGQDGSAKIKDYVDVYQYV